MRGRSPARPPSPGEAEPAVEGTLAHRFALAAVVACVLFSVTYLISDPDLWQHLLVGRAIWLEGRIPQTHQWTWPSLGTPEVLPSWGFRMLLWPVWEAGGVWGLFAWRWVTTLAAFGILWWTARRMGARGWLPLLAVVMCVLEYRLRSMVRPETLVAVLLALELWVLETRRRGGADRSLWLVPLLWAWIQIHLSYFLGFVVAGVYLADALLPGRLAGRAPAAGRLGLAVLAAAAAIWLNPFGARAVWQPFDFLLHQRNELIFLDIPELGPIQWQFHWSSGLPLLIVGWPLLLLFRVGGRPWDRVEWALLALFTWLGLTSQRFLGLYVLVAFPFVAARLGAVRVLPAMPRRAALATAVLAIGLTALDTWARPAWRPGVGFAMQSLPVAACDAMVRERLSGRLYNPFDWGGYLLWRFWPERARLPFMDIHQSGTREQRDLYIHAQQDPAAWNELQRRWPAEIALLRRPLGPRDRLPRFVESDSAWRLVFLDDAAGLYVRRTPEFAALADSLAYRWLGLGDERIAAAGREAGRDSGARAAIRTELERSIRESPRHATAASLLANVALLEGDAQEAVHWLGRARSIDPHIQRVDERLGMAAMLEGRPADAIAHFERERRHGGGPELEARLAEARAARARAGDR